ncbi:eCIS core domain-containing protein [Geodermatophilus sp. SYSU D01105]
MGVFAELIRRQASTSPGSVVRTGPGAGQPVEPGVRHPLEAFHGHDFSGVPVRAESQAGRGAVRGQGAAAARRSSDPPAPVDRDVLQAAGESRDGAPSAATLGGVPLDASVRAAMEAGFGHDFSAVRVHADERAGDAARSLHASAFTIGTRVAFARGAYRPRTPGGLRLIAHELAHVVQQDGRTPVGSVSDLAGERVADEAAHVVAAGGRAYVSPLAVTGPQCSPDPPPGGGPARSPALTPQEMWTQLVQSKRGFESSSSGAGDAYRSSPATVPPGSLRVDEAGNPVAKGAPLGKGYETFAGVQLVDAEGNRVAVAADSFRSGGPDDHAEARCVRALEKDGPARLAGGKLVVVSDQAICPTCRQRLVNYARSRGLAVIEPHEPVRPKMVGSGEASPKTTSRSSTQAGRPQPAIVAREPIPVPPSAPPAPQSAPPTSPAKPPAKPPTKPPAPQQTPAAQPAPPPEGTSAAAPRAAPTPERGVVKGKRVSLEVQTRGGQPRVRVTAIDTAGVAKDEAPHLSRTPKGAALATATTVASVGRTLLDLYASASDEATRTTIEKITHPVESRLRSAVFDAEQEFLATHPDPATLASKTDVDRLRAVYEAEWRRLGAHRVRAMLLAVSLAVVPEDRRGPDWHAAMQQLSRGAVAPPQDLASFRAAAEAYESRAIDVLQEIAPHPLGLPQLAAEIDRRAQMLETVADDLEKTFWEAVRRFPLASTALLELHSISQFVGELAGRMRGFAQTVRGRYQAYVDLDEKLSAQLQRVGEHIGDPGKAIMQAPPRPR